MITGPFAPLPWISEEKRRSGLYDCVDCGINTLDIGHFYHVIDEVWQQVPEDRRKRMLCIPCLELHVGRELDPSDFGDAPINVNAAMNDERIAQRMFGPTWRTIREMIARWVDLYGSGTRKPGSSFLK